MFEFYSILNSVVLGDHSRKKSEKSEKVIPIGKWITHENATDYTAENQRTMWKDGILNNDFSMIALKWPVNYTNVIQPICLPTAPDNNYFGKNVVVSGWGYTAILGKGKFPYKELSDYLKQTNLIVVSEERCRNTMKEYYNKYTVICAFGVRDFNRTIHEDAYVGDSGGNIE